MLDANLKDQSRPIWQCNPSRKLVASLDDGAKSRELGQLLEEIAGLSEMVDYVRADDDARRPSFLIRRAGTDISIRFAGIPMGHEFTSLVLALLQVGGHPSKASQEVIEQIGALEGDYSFETYFSLSCQNCPDVVQALNLMSVINHGFATSPSTAPYSGRSESRKILSSRPSSQASRSARGGWSSSRLYEARRGAASRAAEKIKQAHFDVSSSRGRPRSGRHLFRPKGIRTGIVAERFGGQVWTRGIENFRRSVTPRSPFAAQLEQHVRL